MLEAFKEYLDQMFYQGYADQFEDDNPMEFYSQYREFRLNHGGLPL
ncbi:hypothetical protein [Pedobacter kyungheensis]|nr:hypothetical protein [Pedobacter kyungheensis]